MIYNLDNQLSGAQSQIQDMQAKAALEQIQMQYADQKKQIDNVYKLKSMADLYNQRPTDFNETEAAYIREMAPKYNLDISKGLAKDKGTWGNKAVGFGVGALDSLLFDLIPDNAYENRHNKGWSTAGKWGATLASLAMGGYGAYGAIKGAKALTAAGALKMTAGISDDLAAGARKVLSSNADEVARVLGITSDEVATNFANSSYDDILEALGGSRNSIAKELKELKSMRGKINNTIGKIKNAAPKPSKQKLITGEVVEPNLQYGAVERLSTTHGSGNPPVLYEPSGLPVPVTGPIPTMGPGAHISGIDDLLEARTLVNSKIADLGIASKSSAAIRKQLTGVQKIVGEKWSSMPLGESKKTAVSALKAIKTERKEVLADLQEKVASLSKKYDAKTFESLTGLQSKLKKLDKAQEEISKLAVLKERALKIVSNGNTIGMSKNVGSSLANFNSLTGWGKARAGVGALSAVPMIVATPIRNMAPTSYLQTAQGPYGAFAGLFGQGGTAAHNLSNLPQMPPPMFGQQEEVNQMMQQ